MYLERLRIFAVRLFTGMDRNGPNNRNGIPELMSSFKSSENIQKKEGGPDRSVSDKTLQKIFPSGTGRLIFTKLGM